VIEIVLVRHAEPDWEPGGIAVDHPVLTERGRAQAVCVADGLADEQDFDDIYLSPLPRALETAQPLLDRLGRKALVEPWIEELRLPPLEGKSRDEVASFFEQSRSRDMDDWWFALPGGEHFRHFYERVSAGVEGLLVGQHRLSTHENTGHRLWSLPEADRRILIVAHQGTNAVILSHLLGIEPVPWAWLRFQSCHAGISRVHTTRAASGSIWVLDYFNRVTHLAPLGELTY
jgi:probable phosphoglycerate mutase